MQRSLAGIAFLVAGVLISIGVGTWWLQRTALTPEATPGKTAAILDDTQIRAEITAVVTAATALTLDRSPGELSVFIDRVIDSRPGAAVMADIVAAAHGRAIGNHDDPVRISGTKMVEIVRHQAVGDLPPVTLPVAEIGPLALLANTLGWVAAVTLVAGVLALLFGLIVRPERGEFARGVGETCLALAASLVLFGYLIPVFALPGVNDSTWMATVPRLAMRTAPFVIGAAVVLIAIGLLLVLRAANVGRRKQWSTPLSVGRYREDRSWS